MYRVASPLGQLTLTSDGQALTGLWMEGQSPPPLCQDVPGAGAEAVFSAARRYLTAYFDGAPRLPPLPPLSPAGSAFRLAVWRLLTDIPRGQVTTYGALAQALTRAGRAASPRAVGGAVGRNPISILIPCHRVVGADGTLTGYAGGLPRKALLLDLEKADLTQILRL